MRTDRLSLAVTGLRPAAPRSADKLATVPGALLLTWTSESGNRGTDPGALVPWCSHVPISVEFPSQELLSWVSRFSGKEFELKRRLGFHPGTRFTTIRANSSTRTFHDN